MVRKTKKMLHALAVPIIVNNIIRNDQLKLIVNNRTIGFNLSFCSEAKGKSIFGIVSLSFNYIILHI